MQTHTKYANVVLKYNQRTRHGGTSEYPALWRQKLAISVYIVSFRTAKATERNPVLNHHHPKKSRVRYD